MRSNETARRFRPSLSQLEGRENPASLYTAAGTIAGGAPVVQVAAPGGATLARINPFDASFTGGVRAATGELDGDPNTVEVAVVPGAGGGPRVQVFSVSTADGSVRQIADFFAFESTFRDGLRVAVGRLDPSSATDQIIVGADSGGGPRVRELNLVGGQPQQVAGVNGNFFAFEPTFRGGVRVAAGDVDGNPANGEELIVGAGTGGAPRVRALLADGTATQDFFAQGLTGFNGVNVGFQPGTNGGFGTILSDAQTNDLSQRNAALNAPILAQLAAAQTAQQGVLGNTSAVTFGGTGGSPFTINGGTFNGGVTTGTGLTFSNAATAGGFTNGLFNSGTGFNTGTGFNSGLFSSGTGFNSGVFGSGFGTNNGFNSLNSLNGFNNGLLTNVDTAQTNGQVITF